MEKSSEILKQILYGGSLKDKLSGASLRASDVEWDSGVVENLPDSPGREGVLRPLTDSHASDKKTRFPKKSELKNLSSRGMLLHFFANHELLAIETMAYTLLKFPEAPLEFKKGVMKTLQDEQRHLGLYVERMHEFGVELGQVPLNLYFWNILKTMHSPLDFVTRMSLTFEQANLDFALEYAEIFRKEIADEKTAALLKQVHDDEVKHVAHGVHWFKEWKPSGESEWESYQKLLPFPLTPRRAKGAHYFSALSREQAGLSADYIQNLKIAGGSRGRVPDYFYFNPQAELESQFSGFSAALKTKIRDLSPLLLWLAQEDDVVELSEKPSLAWLSELHAWRGELPEIITDISETSKYVAFEELRPWGWGASAWKRFEVLKSKIRKPPSFSDSWHTEKGFSKAWWKEKIHSPGLVLMPNSSPKVLEGWLEAEPASEFLLKTSMSTSGRGHLRVAREALTQEVQKKMVKEKSVVIEPFLKKTADFSIQYEILANGTLKQWDPRFFLIDEQFQYLGSILGSAASLEGLNSSWTEVHTHLAEVRKSHETVLAILKEEKYVGPVGIDALVYESHSATLQIQPVIEVNARFTMGRVAHEIERCLRPRMGKEPAIWLMVNRRQLKKLGSESFSALKASLELNYGKEKVFFTSPVCLEDGTEVETSTVAVLGSKAILDFLRAPGFCR